MKRLIVSIVVALAGCATIPPEQQLNYEGNIAIESHDYRTARDKFGRSLEQAHLSGNRQYAAMAMYGIARANGYLCNHGEAEEWFKKSIALREGIPDSDMAYLSQNILELARLYVSQGKWSLAAEQFGRALPMLERLNIEGSDPIGYADVLADYASSLRQSGRLDEAMKVETRIRQLRSAYPSRKPLFAITPYPASCP